MTAVFKTLKEIEDLSRKGFDISYCWWSRDSPVRIARNENVIVETASTIKLLIMAKLLHEAEKDRVDIAREMRVTTDSVGRHGSGILQRFSLPESMKIENLLVLMMCISDNTATNVLIKMLGVREINSFAGELGLENTRLLMEKLDFDDTVDFSKPLVGQTTAYEMAKLIDKILFDDFFSPAYKEKAMTLMKASQTSMIKSQLLSGERRSLLQQFGSKTGRLAPLEAGKLFVGEAGFIIDQNNIPHVFAQYLLSSTGEPASDTLAKFASAACLFYDEWRTLDTTHAKKTHSKNT